MADKADKIFTLRYQPTFRIVDHSETLKWHSTSLTGPIVEIYEILSLFTNMFEAANENIQRCVKRSKKNTDYFKIQRLHLIAFSLSTCH